MERRHIKWLPLLLAGLFFAYQYFSSEKFVNPETGRKSHVAMSTREEASLEFRLISKSWRSRRVSIRDRNSIWLSGWRHDWPLPQGKQVPTSTGRCPDSFFAGKRVLFAGRQDRGLHRHFTGHAK